MQGVFEESLVWSMILQPILHTATKEACEDRLTALANFSSSMHLQLKKRDKNKNRKHRRGVGIADKQKSIETR